MDAAAAPSARGSLAARRNDGQTSPPTELAPRNLSGRRVAGREDDAHAFLDGQTGLEHLVARDEHDVAEVKVVRRDEQGDHLALAVRSVHEDVARDEREGIRALARMLDEHDRAERASPLGA